MTREEYIKNSIINKGYSIREFAEIVQIPYTSLLSMLKNIGGAGVDSVIKICTGLGITVDDLQNYENNEIKINVKLTPHERGVITAYINQPEMRPAVDKILGVEESENKIYTIPTAARSKDGKKPGTEEMTADEIEELLSIEEINP